MGFLDSAGLARVRSKLEKMFVKQPALAIKATGNTHAAIASGQYVYVSMHSSLADGLYQATAAVNANGALSTSNLSAVPSGAANALQSQVDTLNSNLTNKLDASKFITVTNRQATGSANANAWFYASYLNLTKKGTGIIYCQNDATLGIIKVVAPSGDNSKATIPIVSGYKYSITMLAD